MPGLTGAELLRVWEESLAQHPLDRALTLLHAAEPGSSRAELARLDVAERDARLYRLRAELFGRTLSAFAVCPACGERLEFSIDTGELGVVPESPGEWSVEADGVAVRFRLPDSRDLAAAASAGNAAAARAELAARCVVSATAPDGRELDPRTLGEPVLAALSARMAEVAPTADVRLDLTCPACGHAWEILLDIGEFLWAEIANLARRLLREVHALARAYGWSEAEILAMSPRRRQSYLELI